MEAAGRVIAASGLCAVTHRAVAAEAGVSLARTTYHFPTVGELLEATQVHITATRDDRLLELVRLVGEGQMNLVDACCAFLGEIVGPQRPVFLARVELGVAAARQPDLASMMSDATRGIIASMAEFGVSVEWATATLAAMYGFAALAVTAPSVRRRDPQVRRAHRSPDPSKPAPLSQGSATDDHDHRPRSLAQRPRAPPRHRRPVRR